MPENNERRGFLEQTENITVGADGTCYRSGQIYPVGDVAPSEIKEAMAEARGVDPANIAVGHEDVRKFEARSESGRLSVGFTKWNSSWDPHADRGDPTMN